MSISSCSRVGSPGIIESVAFNLEWSTRTTQFVAHLLKKSFERRLLDSHQLASDLVSSVMMAAEIRKLSEDE